MASLARLGYALKPSRILSITRTQTAIRNSYASRSTDADIETHTGQQFEETDYRLIRFADKSKLVTKKWAIDMIREDPVVVCSDRVVFSDSCGALGHPRVYINLDPPGVHVCGYSGRKFIHKKYYNEKEHGPSITYETYLKEMDPQPKDYPI